MFKPEPDHNLSTAWPVNNGDVVLPREWPRFEQKQTIAEFKARVTWYYQQNYGGPHQLWIITRIVKLFIFVTLDFDEYYNFLFYFV